MITKFKLDSGIKVIAETILNSRSCCIGVWVKSGSVLENKNENGISHFIEHMLFKGTEKRSAKNISYDADRMGAQLNAFTSKEYTCYYIKVIDERIDDAAELLSDLFLHPVFDSEEMEKERGVILEEISMYNDTPDEVAHEACSSLFFSHTDLEKTILGPSEIISTLTPQNLKDYYDEKYSNNNIVIAVSGNFDELKLKESLNRYFNISRYSVPNTVCYENETYGSEFKREIINKDIEQVHICYAFPGYSFKNSKRYALNVVNNIIGGNLSSRLFQKIREENGLAYSIYSFISSYYNTGMFSVYAGTSQMHYTEVDELIVSVLQDILSNGFIMDEFLQGKEQLKSSYIFSLESVSSRMMAIGKNYLFDNTIFSPDEMIEIINEISIDDSLEILADVINFNYCASALVGKF